MFEKRHTRISINSTVLHDISSYHPFTQQVGEYSFFFTGEDPWSLSLSHTHAQIDVIFPSQCRELENALSALQTCFAKGRVDLASMFTTGSEFVHPYGTSFSEGTQDTPRQVSSHSVRPPHPPLPKKQSARRNTDNLLPRLSSVRTSWSLELSDKNCISWIFSCCDFFFLAFCLFESTTRHRSDIVAVSLNRVCGMRNDDVWCVDTRGVLTMCVCKETYEKLGLVGQRMPFKNWSGERYGMCDIDVCLSAALQFLY